ncbi:hypothetical protein [Nocardiopsis eucommiae]|uniref:hypothetical protein n=1 Tax=Nocardiopsis eucommiae TaxID=2831970 RepID=UPI003D74E28C
MADTQEKDAKRGRPAKKGLHGWKAALTVFGCGTFAAFGVFGVIVGVLSLFVTTVSSGLPSGESSTNPPGAGIGAPRADLEVGQMDVCSDNLDNLTSISVDRRDSGDSYLDTVDPDQIDIDGALRVVSDQCQWELISMGNSTPWDFSFNYEVVIDADSGINRDDLAAARFDVLKSELPDLVENVENETESPMGEHSYSVYGSGDSGQSVYAALIRTRSAVYTMHFEDRAVQSTNRVGEGTFQGEGRKISNFLGQGFEYWIPA